VTPAQPARRRCLQLLASSCLLPVTGWSSAAPAAALKPVRWRGMALGGPADVVLYHPDAAQAEQALAEVTRELAELEAQFSLFLPDSALSRLNRDGRLDAAPAALLALLGEIDSLHAHSGGAFDPTVQPLWQLYAEHFARAGAEPTGPDAGTLAAVRARVGYRHVQRHARTVAFDRADMALTLNGIAQGFITDRVRARLAAAGMPHALVNLGEYAALGPHPDGGPWQIVVPHPVLPWRSVARLPLTDGMAIATSAGAGTPFSGDPAHHHLFDPQSGRSADGWRSVSVVAPSATLADGLSTALAVAPPARTEAILRHYPAAGALALDSAGQVRRFGTLG